MYRVITKEFRKNYGCYFNQKTWAPYITKRNIRKTFATTIVLGTLIGYNNGSREESTTTYVNSTLDVMICSIPYAIGGALMGATFPISLPLYMISYRQFYDRNNYHERTELLKERHRERGY